MSKYKKGDRFVIAINDTVDGVFGDKVYVFDQAISLPETILDNLTTYEDEKAKDAVISVGDEVIHTADQMRGIVTRIDRNEFNSGTTLSAVREDGRIEFGYEFEFEKTGKHFPEMVELMQKFSEKEEEK